MSLPKYGEYSDSGVMWLNAIPSHWAVVQSRRYFKNRNEKALASDKQLTASQKHGILYQADFMELEGQKVTQVILGADILKHVEPNDFVISMRSFQGGIEWSGYSGSISSAYVMLVPGDSICCPFYSYLFKSKPYIQALQTTTNLVRDGQALRFSNFAQVQLPLLPLDEQRTIAAFLDRETSKIDALIAEQEKLNTLLAEKRQAMISHAVTCGLNPDVPMKDSGVAWLGGVPAHWEVRRLKYLCKVQTGDKDTVNAVEDGHYPFFVRSQTVEKINSYTFDCEAVLTAGDGAGVGKVFHYYAGKFDFHQRVYMMNNFQFVSGRFLFMYLATMFHKVALDGVAKSTVDSLRMPIFLNFMVTNPPPCEQQEILEFIEIETTKLDTLKAEAERAIALLKERRNALIAAAVTGRIDVRGAVQQQAARAEAIAA